MGHPIKHFLTITNHRHKVIANCARAGILWQGLRHDLSKYSPTEFIPGAKFFQGDRSPNEKEREIYGSSRAWMHHKGRNRHHYEYWNDYNAVREEGKSPIIYVQMPRKYVVEMLMDRISASETYRGTQYTQHDPLKYFLNGRGRTLMHPQTAKELERMLRILDRRGQAELDRFVRDYYLKGYPV